jgi:predicted membrane protein
MDTNFKVHHHHRHGITFSIILIVVGVVFLGVNTGMLPILYRPLFSSWPIWCIFGGLYLLLERSFFSASVLLTLGTFFIIPQIGSMNPGLNIPANFTQIYWPALLIVAGIYFALHRFFKPCCIHKQFNKFCNSDIHTSKWDSEDGYLQVSSSFESRKNIVLDPVFKGGDVECSFGEIILDLRKTTLPEGNIKLNVKVSFGSVTIIVPNGWNVQLRGDSTFGTFSDNRLSHSYNTEDKRVLIIDGKCSFGDCKLRD